MARGHRHHAGRAAAAGLLAWSLILAGCERPTTYTLTECSLDGGPWASCTSPVEYHDLEAGPHSVTVRATTYRQQPDGSYAQTGQDEDTWQWTQEGPP